MQKQSSSSSNSVTFMMLGWTHFWRTVSSEIISYGSIGLELSDSFSIIFTATSWLEPDLVAFITFPKDPLPNYSLNSQISNIFFTCFRFLKFFMFGALVYLLLLNIYSSSAFSNLSPPYCYLTGLLLTPLLCSLFLSEQQTPPIYFLLFQIQNIKNIFSFT